MTEVPLNRTQRRQLQLDSLELLARKVREAESDIPEKVIAARRAKASWQQIGDVLGTSRQAAWEKYHVMVDEELDRIENQTRPAWG